MILAGFFPLGVALVLAVMGYRRAALGALVVAICWAGLLAYGAHACATNAVLVAAGGCNG